MACQVDLLWRGWNNVLLAIYLPARERERIFSGDLYIEGVQPKGLLGAAAN